MVLFLFFGCHDLFRKSNLVHVFFNAILPKKYFSSSKVEIEKIEIDAQRPQECDLRCCRSLFNTIFCWL